MKEKPRLFIGSSVESLKVAYAIQENFEHDALCNVWNQGIFELSGNALDNLLEATNNYDFAIFVFKPDDITKIRDQEFSTVRDNLIFELGLFISRLSKKNVFFLIPRNIEKLHLPTDLLGIEPGHFDFPEKDKDLLAALGPFCNKVRRQMNETIVSKGVLTKLVENNNTIVKKTEKDETKLKHKSVEYGVSIDDFGNYKISIAPTVFFSSRIAKAFPGIRGLEWFNDSKLALDRLEILLKHPLSFEKAIGYGVSDEPIWWSRGNSDLAITKFSRINDTRCLMDEEELEIDKIAVFHSDRYWQCFVYVEVNGQKPIGIYNHTDEEIKYRIDNYGYAYEEFGLYEGIPITRACYDDGAAVIDNKVTDTSGAELRIRYLSKYNFIISSRFSPIASKKFEMYSKKVFNDILIGKDKLENMLEFILTLEKHEHDS